MTAERSTCKECLWSSICPNKRQKGLCKECGGSQICEHNRQRNKRKECLGSGICPHKCIKSRCEVFMMLIQGPLECTSVFPEGTAGIPEGTAGVPEGGGILDVIRYIVILICCL